VGEGEGEGTYFHYLHVMESLPDRATSYENTMNDDNELMKKIRN